MVRFLMLKGCLFIILHTHVVCAIHRQLVITCFSLNKEALTLFYYGVNKK